PYVELGRNKLAYSDSSIIKESMALSERLRKSKISHSSIANFAKQHFLIPPPVCPPAGAAELPSKTVRYRKRVRGRSLPEAPARQWFRRRLPPPVPCRSPSPPFSPLPDYARSPPRYCPGRPVHAALPIVSLHHGNASP